MLESEFSVTNLDGDESKFQILLSVDQHATELTAKIRLKLEQREVEQEIRGYVAWGESPYSAIARCVHLLHESLTEKYQATRVSRLHISIAIPGLNEKNEKVESSLTFFRYSNGGTLTVSGLDAIVWPIPDAPYEMVSLSTCLLSVASRSPLNLEALPSEPQAVVYSGGDAEPFMFMDEVPAHAQSWFHSYLQKFARSEILHGDTVATYKAWEAFRNGSARY
jgi:hypothetical protein